VTPLIWIYKYNPKFEQTFYFKEPLKFPAGTKILVSSPDAGTLSFYAAAPGASNKPATKTSAQLTR
jgi:hypothetical protein